MAQFRAQVRKPKKKGGDREVDNYKEREHRREKEKEVIRCAHLFYLFFSPQHGSNRCIYVHILMVFIMTITLYKLRHLFFKEKKT